MKKAAEPKGNVRPSSSADVFENQHELPKRERFDINSLPIGIPITPTQIKVRENARKALEAMTGPTREEVDAKIAASEARTDTKFAEVMGELKAINAATSGTKTTVIATGIGAVAIVIAVFAYGSQMLGTGLDADSIARQAATSVQATSATQIEALNARYDRLEADISTLIQALNAPGASDSAPQQE